MEDLPSIIIDLAYILVIAGAVTIIFKRFRQPLVLGYIVAGFLAGPYMPYTPSITDSESINDWSQIGVIFLMFTLGLEFSFKKIIRMGLRPIIAALCVMGCMISVGNTVGMLFGWSQMDRLFLGGMLAMSSTTIIYKAFDDLGLLPRKFASGVLSVLILEDILGILLMVMLSALAASNKFQGMQLITNLLQLGFFLLLWFLVGIYIVPLILRKNKNFINTETLLIVSVGLCFLLVVLASYVGYSPAFGAFMMGSILAETVEAERIEHTVSSLKDLFGAIFFVSVGMLVNPSVLIQYWLPILVITLSVVIGQATLGSLSYLVAGNPLKEAIQSGFSMAQIGEFAFIIAALGQTLGVTSSFLYPVVVAVSIVTTFLTPYMIRAAEPAYQKLQSRLPARLTNAIEKRSQHTTQSNRRSEVSQEFTPHTAWKTYSRMVFLKTIAWLTICLAVTGISFSSILPLCRQAFTTVPGNIICALLTLSVISPLVRPIIMQHNHTASALYLRDHNVSTRLLYYGLTGAKYFFGWGIIFNVLNHLSPLPWIWQVPLSLLVTWFIIRSKRIKLLSIRIQRTFLSNLRSREEQSDASSPTYGRALRGKDLHIASLTLPHNTAWGGSTLAQLHIGRTDRVNVVAILRGTQRINIPGGKSKVFAGDILEVVGDDTSIQGFSQRMKAEVISADSATERQHRLTLRKMDIAEASPLCGQTLAQTDIRTNYHCMVVGIEDKRGTILPSQPNRTFQPGDTLWVVGEDSDLAMLRMGL